MHSTVPMNSSLFVIKLCSLLTYRGGEGGNQYDVFWEWLGLVVKISGIHYLVKLSSGENLVKSEVCTI